MDRKTIETVLRTASGGSPFICKNQIKTGLCWGSDRVARYTRNLDGIKVGKGKKLYLIKEVAESIYADVE